MLLTVDQTVASPLEEQMGSFSNCAVLAGSENTVTSVFICLEYNINKEMLFHGFLDHRVCCLFTETM